VKITVELDDYLVCTAQEFTGVAGKTALLREALKALIERESARRLASLGATMPRLKNIPRRRSTLFHSRSCDEQPLLRKIQSAESKHARKPK
jgi:Arc/MetJ family transcription regulator